MQGKGTQPGGLMGPKQHAYSQVTYKITDKTPNKGEEQKPGAETHVWQKPLLTQEFMRPVSQNVFLRRQEGEVKTKALIAKFTIRALIIDGRHSCPHS